MFICIKSFDKTYSVSLIDYNPVNMKLTEYPTVNLPYLERHINIDNLSSSCIDVSYSTHCAFFTYRLNLRDSEIRKLFAAYEAVYEEIRDSSIFIDYPEVFQLLDLADDEVVFRDFFEGDS